MEVDEIQNPQSGFKYSRVNSNGRLDSSKIGVEGGGSSGGPNSINDRDNEVVVDRAVVSTTAISTSPSAVAVAGNGNGGGIGGADNMQLVGSSNRFGRQWQHSSRIIRVSRASGGKDRHSKVWTAKGPRDRRVRLSVTTAIQFYDLQDRLGYDQPSKAVEWLIKAAQDAINELPALNTTSFPPETPRQLSDERRAGGNVVDSGDVELDGDANLGHNQQQLMGSKMGCSTSNNSETSKGSGLSLSRSEIRVKARERAKERMAKEKDRDGEPSRVVNVASQSHNHHHNHQQQQQQNVSSMPQTTSFTQLLTAGMNNLNESNNGAASSSPSPHHHGSGEVSLFHKHSRDGSNSNNQWLSSGCSSSTPMADYFGTGLMSLSSSRASQIQLGNNTSSLPPVMTITSYGGSENQHQSQDQIHQHQHQHQHQHFPFLPDQHLLHSRASGGGGGGTDYNLNFTVSSTCTSTTSGLAAGFYNRGTLQSNSPSLLPYLQRFSGTDGSSLPFFLGSAAAVTSASPAVENHHHHHQHQQQFQPPGLQLCYGDGGWQSDQKGKGKN